MVMGFDVKSTGKPRQYPYGAQRDNDDGKPKLRYLMWDTMADEALHMEKGADKYGDSNYRAGIPSLDALDSLYRHLLCIWVGDMREDHASAIKFNTNLIEFNKLYFADDPAINNLPQWYIERGFWNEDGTPNYEKIDKVVPWLAKE